MFSQNTITTLLGGQLLLEGAIELSSPHDFDVSFLQKRGISESLDVTSHFFQPSVQALHDPFLFPQMEDAVRRILQAKENNERVIIFGDYDVDGVSSTAMLVRFFAILGIQVSYRIPHRSKDGYGMKTYFFDDLVEKKVKLVISVDCGTRDIAVIQHAKNLGIDVIVTDHHAVPECIPEEAIAVITPKLPGTSYPFSGLSGSGTAFKLLSAVASRVYSEEESNRIIASFADFAALGTVADMVPLIGENRTIVQLGLEQILSSRSPGLRKMIEGKDTGSADCIGFQIGPRINAAGRMDHADIALQALICSEAKVPELLEKLESLNLVRRKSTQDNFSLAEESIDKTLPVLIYAAEDIEHGVIGLVAGRLCEKYKKPSIVCKIEGELVYGSARSQEGYDITDALGRVSKHFIAFGGHAQAAGFSLQLECFKEFFSDICFDATEQFNIPLSTEILQDTIPEPPKNLHKIDYISSIDCIDFELIDSIERYGPYGMKYHKPLFLVYSEILPRIEFLGSSGDHVRFIFQKYPSIKIQGFGMGEYLEKFQGIQHGIGFVCELQRESWKGRTTISLMAKEIIEWGIYT